MIEYKIRVDLQSERSNYTDICLTSGDVKAYRFVFEFFSNGKAFDVSPYVLHIKAKRSDGVLIVDKGVISSEGIAFYDVKSNIYAVAGCVMMEIALATEKGEYVTTTEIIMTVRKGYGNGGLTAENTTPILVKLLECSARAERAAGDAEATAAGLEKFLAMAVSAESLDAGEKATAGLVDEDGQVQLVFGIPAGRTPEKGVDYWTEEDKAEIQLYVEEAILGGAW